MDGLDDISIPYKDSSEYKNNMLNINYMIGLNYTNYEHSTDASAIPVYVDSSNNMTLIKSDNKLLNDNYNITLTDPCPNDQGNYNITSKLIDLQQCKTTDSGTDFSKCGLIYNTEGLLKNIENNNSYNIPYEGCESFKVKEPMTTVNVSNYTSFDGQSDKVEMSAYQSDALTAYNNKCKKYNGMLHCDMYVNGEYSNTTGCDKKNMCDILKNNTNTSSIVKAKDPSGTEINMTLKQWLKKPENEFENNCKRYDGMNQEDCDKCFTTGREVDKCEFGLIGQMRATLSGLGDSAMNELANLQSQSTDQQAETENMNNEINKLLEESTSNTDGFQCFYNRYRQPLNNYVREVSSPSIVSPGYSVSIEKIEEKFHLENDLLTSIYIGSISVLGLYIVYKLMEK